MAVWAKRRWSILTIGLFCLACASLPEETVSAPPQQSAIEVDASGPSDKDDSDDKKSLSTRELSTTDRQLVYIGVLAKDDVANCAIRYKPTADYLTSKIDGYRFTFVPIRIDDFQASVAHGKFDFVLCDPLLYVKLQTIGEVSAIATIRKHFEGVIFSQLGGVVFCRKGRNDIKKLEDIHRKSFAAVSENSFCGWIVGQEFLQSKGIDPKADASKFDFLGTHTKVVHAVTDGVYDVGTVRTGILEQMAKSGAIKMSDYRIFVSIEPSSDFPFCSSTRLYPEWVLAKTNFASDSLAGKVATALYEMPEKSKAAARGYYAGWVVPASYRSVLDCIQKIQGSKKKSQEEFSAAWETYSLFFVITILIVLAFFYIALLKSKMRATDSLMDQCAETVVMKEKAICDLKQRIKLIAGEEPEDFNIIRQDYRIEHVTPEWEAQYGLGVGKNCYEYFADSDQPCEKCGLREAIKTQNVRSIKKSFPRESGRPIEVTTIPLGTNGDGGQIFAQTYCDVLSKNRKTTLSAISQERETRYLLLEGIMRQAEKNACGTAELVYYMRNVISEDGISQKVDVNKAAQQVIQWTEHTWQHLAEIAFNPDPRRPFIWAQEQDVRLVITNLILSAVRCLEYGAFSTERKGRLSISTQVQDDLLTLMVIDNGNGQKMMRCKELSVIPGQDENNRESFIGAGLAPAYDRVFEKWNSKLCLVRMNENQNVRTVFVQAISSDFVVPPVSSESSVAPIPTLDS